MSPKRLVSISLFAALHCLAALLVRFSSSALVPFSLVPLMVILAALLLGAKDGVISLVVYTCLGLAGLPVFAKPPYGGPSYVLQPTFGFVLGYLAAALVTGLVGKDRPSYLRAVTAATLGLTCLYMVGVSYLYCALRMITGTAPGLSQLLAVAFWPFIGFDLLKAVAAVAIAVRIQRRLVN